MKTDNFKASLSRSLIIILYYLTLIFLHGDTCFLLCISNEAFTILIIPMAYNIDRVFKNMLTMGE